MSPGPNQPKRWTDSRAPRIWRSPDSDFYGDEALDAARVYTDDVLSRIAAEGFNAIWLRGRLRELMQGSLFSELESADARGRIESLQTVIERGRRVGVGVYLYFNEPLAVAADAPFWTTHADIKGVEQPATVHEGHSFALCTSAPLVQDFVRGATRDLLARLDGLAGVILITASEFQTHCYSHHVLRYFEAIKTRGELTCPRCVAREPADVVLDLLRIWRDAAAASPTPPRVLAWNWSWSMWYPDPQAEIVERIPEGVELLVDFERGMSAKLCGRTVEVDEYSLAVVGPSERYLKTAEVARSRNVPVHAKVQLGTTHEIATVPNLPLMHNLHAKFAALTAHDVRGIMGTWNFGCSLTLNTFALKTYAEDPKRFASAAEFLAEVARRYFGVVHPAPVVEAWRRFGDAFTHFPFSMSFIYWGPINYGPAYELTPRYEARPMGPSWLTHAFGDRLEDSLAGGFTIDEVIEQLSMLAEKWGEGLALYLGALPENDRHAFEESSCGRMIGVQFRSAANIYRFHRWRNRVGLDDAAREIMNDEIALAKEARELCTRDPRLGFHQECQAYLYDVASIDRKIAAMTRTLQSSR